MADTILNIFKDKMNDDLGITKYNQTLKKKINMTKGKELAVKADEEISKAMKKVTDDAAALMKSYKDGGMSDKEAKSEALKYARSMKDMEMKKARLQNPGFEEALDIELRKKSGTSGLIKDKPLSKRKAPKKKRGPKKKSKSKSKKSKK